MQPDPYEHGRPRDDDTITVEPISVDMLRSLVEGWSKFDYPTTHGLFISLVDALASLQAQVGFLREDARSLRETLYGTADAQPSQGDVEVIRRDVAELMSAEIARDRATLAALDPSAWQGVKA